MSITVEPHGPYKRIVFPPEVLEQATRTFTPLTGNPENGDYGDWLEHLKKTARELGMEVPS